MCGSDNRLWSEDPCGSGKGESLWLSVPSGKELRDGIRDLKEFSQATENRLGKEIVRILQKWKSEERTCIQNELSRVWTFMEAEL